MSCMLCSTVYEIQGNYLKHIKHKNYDFSLREVIKAEFNVSNTGLRNSAYFAPGCERSCNVIVSVT